MTATIKPTHPGPHEHCYWPNTPHMPHEFVYAHGITSDMAHVSPAAQTLHCPGRPEKMTTELDTDTDTALAAQMAEYVSLQHSIKELEERRDALKASLKVAAEPGLTGDTTQVSLSAGGRPVLVLRRTEGWRLDTARLKRETPETYARFAVQTSRVELREV